MYPKAGVPMCSYNRDQWACQTDLWACQTDLAGVSVVQLGVIASGLICYAVLNVYMYLS